MGTARRALVGVGAVVAALAIGGILVAGDDPPPDGVRAVGGAGSSSSTTTTEPPRATPADEAAVPTMVTIGPVGDIAVEVAPRTGLASTAVVTVTVDGADGLPADAIVLMCTGDVGDDSTAASRCDPSAVTDLDGRVGPAVVEGAQEVVVSRFISVGVANGDPNIPGTWDCATEPAGCVLVLAPYRLPPTAVAVPLGFDPAPAATSVVAAEPASGLADGQVVTVEARGLRPRAAHRVSQCAPFEDDDADDAVDPQWSCDWETETGLTADEDGDLLGAVRVAAAIYPPSGRVDCTATPCALVVASEASSVVPAAVELAFAPDVVAPTPVLALDPPGPYADGQTVTLRGTGFPPGLDLAGHIGQCPAGLDTRSEEFCQYGFGPAVVGDDGTFTTTGTVSASLLFTGACADTGCVVGWVITKGATVAAVPIEVTG